MRPFAILPDLLLVVAALACSCDGSASAAKVGTASDGSGRSRLVESSGERWKLVRVIDGDTLVARPASGGGRAQKVRLLRVDTPERDEAGYREAARALASLLGKGDIRLEDEVPGRRRRGNYGRLLAYVFVGDLNVNVELVRLGWSRFWTASWRIGANSRNSIGEKGWPWSRRRELRPRSPKRIGCKR